MNDKNRFAAETVHKLQQALDEVAPYQATELSKQQAIRALSPQIQSLRAKGYGWTAVAAMLSEHGVPVSVAALRTYLRRVREETDDGPRRVPAKRLRDARSDARQPERSPTIASSSSPSGEMTTTTKPQQPSAAPALTGTAQRATSPGTRS